MKKFALVAGLLGLMTLGANAETKTVWEGDFDLKDWTGMLEIGKADGEAAKLFAGAKEGDVIRVNLADLTGTEDKPVQVQVNFYTTLEWQWTTAVEHEDVVGTHYDYTLTDAVIGDSDETDIEMLLAHGIVFKGQQAHITSVEFITDGQGGGDEPAMNETVLWTGDEDLKDWGTIVGIPADPEQAPVVFKDVQENDIIRIYVGDMAGTEDAPVQVQLAFKALDDDWTWTQIVDCADLVGTDHYDYTITNAVVGDTDWTDLELLQGHGLYIKGQKAHIVKVCLLSKSGVKNISDVDFNAPVEYYTIDGCRVANPDKGLYIVRQGKKAMKVIF